MISDKENQWLAKATARAVEGCRKVALASGPLMNTPCGRLTNQQWGMFVCAAIFGWVETKSEQAIAEGVMVEDLVRVTELDPDPRDVAAVTSILPALCDGAKVDWSQPLADWTKPEMVGFLLLALRLVHEAEHARDHGAGHFLKAAEYDWKTGDPIPPV